MINNEVPYCGKRYIGNKETRLLHDFERGDCQVAPELARTFHFPKDAYEEGFKDCPRCIRQIFLGSRMEGPPTNFNPSDNNRVVIKTFPGPSANKAINSIKGK